MQSGPIDSAIKAYSLLKHWAKRDLWGCSLQRQERKWKKKLFNFLSCCCFLSFSHVAGSRGGTLRNNVHTDALPLIGVPVCQVFWVEVKGRESESKQKQWEFLVSFCSWTKTKAHCIATFSFLVFLSLSLGTSFFRLYLELLNKSSTH